MCSLTFHFPCTSVTDRFFYPKMDLLEKRFGGHGGSLDDPLDRAIQPHPIFLIEVPRSEQDEWDLLPLGALSEALDQV